ncbi:MAG: hypothetical protein U0360_03880 [Dehalococcoidia bacterium]
MTLRVLGLVLVMLLLAGAVIARSRRNMKIEDELMEEAIDRFEGEGGRVAS